MRDSLGSSRSPVCSCILPVARRPTVRASGRLPREWRSQGCHPRLKLHGRFPACTIGMPFRICWCSWMYSGQKLFDLISDLSAYPVEHASHLWFAAKEDTVRKRTKPSAWKVHRVPCCQHWPKTGLFRYSRNASGLPAIRPPEPLVWAPSLREACPIGPPISTLSWYRFVQDPRSG
jgi:hypothetical protein